ncbi:MAG: hypothetical protein EOL97_12740 [Spirochaetia bacterium]|nr:hypothetical protein [Spirochaetia bacterium]
MHIGNKIFPYPILNNNIDLSTYTKDSTFELIFDQNENNSFITTEDYIILKNIHFKLNNQELYNLYKENKIKCSLIIECSSSLYRKNFLISDKPIDIKIKINELKNNVNISAFIYANEDIFHYKNDSFIEEYKEYKFKIEKYDIIAIDDGFSFNIEINPEKDKQINSIFTLAMHDRDKNIMYYDMGTNEIEITLPPKYFQIYNSIKNTNRTNNIMFSIILIPVLSKCLDDIKNQYDSFESIDEIIFNWNWFKSICIGYETITNKKLNLEEFQNQDSLTLSQLLINKASCNALNDLNNYFINMEQEDGETEDE